MSEQIPAGEDLATEVSPKGETIETSLHYRKEPLGRKPLTEDEELKK